MLSISYCEKNTIIFWACDLMVIIIGNGLGNMCPKPDALGKGMNQP